VTIFPNWADCMNDVLCLEVVAIGDSCLSRGTATESFALICKFRACSSVNGAIHSKSGAKLFIGCIYYGINLQLGYVAELEGDAAHWGVGLLRFWPG